MNFDQYILNKTKRNYNLIGDRFSETRTKPWKNFRFLFEDVSEGADVLDLGCGNGRFFEILKIKNVNYIGIDKSEKLISKAKERYPEADFKVGDGLDIPCPNNEFDYVFSIAVLHHIPSENMRIDFLREIKRVLKPEGKVRITVWNKIDGDKSIYFKNLKDKLLGRMSFRDAFIPWKNGKGEIITERYYHFFKKKELRKLLEKAGLVVDKVFIKGRNTKSNIFVFAKNEN